MGFGNGPVDVVVSTPLRTAIGTFGGALKDVPATDLGATVGKAVIERSDSFDPRLHGHQAGYRFDDAVVAARQLGRL
jgi:acetyl-CoA acetyltransferase